MEPIHRIYSPGYNNSNPQMTGSGPCHLIIIYREVSPGTCKKPERHTLSRGRPGPIASTLAVIPKEFYFGLCLSSASICFVPFCLVGMGKIHQFSCIPYQQQGEFLVQQLCSILTRQSWKMCVKGKFNSSSSK